MSGHGRPLNLIQRGSYLRDTIGIVYHKVFLIDALCASAIVFMQVKGAITQVKGAIRHFASFVLRILNDYIRNNALMTTFGKKRTCFP